MNVAERGGIDDDLAAREALAAVVVHVAFDANRDARRAERADALAGRAAEVELDRVFRQTLRAVTARDFAARGSCRRCG